MTCHVCGSVGFSDGADGFFYCGRCGSQAEDIIDTGVAEEDFVAKGDARGAIYSASHRRQRHSIAPKPEPLSQSQSQFLNNLTLDDDYRVENEETREETVADEVGPSGPSDFGLGLDGSDGLSFEDYYTQLRIRYVMGVQIMIELQCQALVEKFKASPLICGVAGTIWLRFVATTRVFDDEWADKVIQDSEMQKPGESEDLKPRAKYSAEPHNIYGQRAVIIWHRSLKKKIPLSCSLVISFLACHIAREAILPTDILKWSLEGKLPYFAAFIEIEKQIGPPSSPCPLSSSFMFRPSEAIPLQKLEAQAASIADFIGLHLPPVNFYAIAFRYLEQLFLPVEKILPYACRVYEWSMPPDLWLSANELRLPTRVCVMSILIVTIRILYNVHGFGKWEMSLSSSSGSSSSSNRMVKLNASDNIKMMDGAKQGSPSHDLNGSNEEPVTNSSHAQKSEFDATELLCNLDARYDELIDTYEYSKDLPTYLQYCKDVVFAGLELPFEDHEEEKIIEQLWEFYQNQKDSEPSEDLGVECGSALNEKRSRNDEGCINSIPKEKKKIRDDCSVPLGLDGDDTSLNSQGGQKSVPTHQASVETLKEEAILRMKADMEENRFCYIPPRVNVKRFDYLHYVRKKDEGSYIYAAHADYYILLRACARVAQVDVRSMHVGVMSLERRLGWIEKRIDHCLHFKPPKFSSDPCNDDDFQV